MTKSYAPPDDTPPEHHNAGGTEDWRRLWPSPAEAWAAVILLGLASWGAVFWLL